MPGKSKKNKSPLRRMGPKHRVPTHPGEMLLEEFLIPMQISQSELARRMQVPPGRISTLVSKKRSMTADTALRLERVLGLKADFWMGLQQSFDLWNAASKIPDDLEPFESLRAV